MIKNLGKFFLRKQMFRYFCQGPSFSTNQRLSEKTVSNLQKHGYTNMTKIQEATFEEIFSMQNVIARDKTGQGKTLAFALPIVERLRENKKFGNIKGPLALVITPTRELAIQVYEQFQKLRNHNNEFQCSLLFGGTSYQFSMNQIEGNVDILIGTPGKLIDFLRREAINLDNLEALVLDETDTMLNMGFEDAINKIFKNVPQTNLKDLQCVLFSATIPKWVQQISKKNFGKEFKMISMVDENDNDIPKNIRNYYCSVQNEQEKQQLLQDIVLNQIKKKFDSKILVFANQRRSIKEIQNSSFLIQRISACLSSDQQQTQRQFYLQGFKQSIFKCILCTDVASRGLDIDNVDLVIQYDLQNDPEQFVHRTGRVGRMNKEGYNIFFVGPRDRDLVNKIKKQYKFYYHDFNDYLDRYFLEEMKDHDLNQPFDEIGEDEQISVRFKIQDKYKSGDEKREIVNKFLQQLQEKEQVKINVNKYQEDLETDDPIEKNKNIYYSVQKKDFEELQFLTSEFGNNIKVYPQSNMYIETKKILNKIDVGDIDISSFFRKNQVALQSYKVITINEIESYARDLYQKELINEEPVVREIRNGKFILNFTDTKNVCRFMQEAQNLILNGKKVDVNLNYQNLNNKQRSRRNQSQYRSYNNRDNNKNDQQNQQE